MKKNGFLAFDLGASSGRAILGNIKNDTLKLTEIYRFRNEMSYIHGHYYWDIYYLFKKLKKGLRKCISKYGIQPVSIGIDTWGVDYVLVSAEGNITALPFAYRDHRTDSAMEDFFRHLSKKETYALTGLQFLQFNTLFQLFASAQSGFSGLKIAESLLFMPDALGYLFTGKKRNEYTIASTSQMMQPGKPQWEYKLFDASGIPHKLMEEIILPGNKLGTILPEVMEETGSLEIPCIAVAGHDTASAVVSVPAEGKNWAYLSSGTWSLLGIESVKPIVSEQTLAMNFTNEGGVDGTTRFLKNIMGMWLIQECKRIWDQDKETDWHSIVEESQKVPHFISIIDPDNPVFLNPGNMPKAIQNFCAETKQPVPRSIGEIARCIYDSLALKYKFTIKQIESVTGKKIERLHIIGGGAHNNMLNQLTADVLEIPVIAGPTEATAIGNIMLQARAAGVVNSLEEIRAVVRNSFKTNLFIPSPKVNWEDAFERFNKLS
ncbi:MAG: rhamnulokinase [Draconibacterium sp.]|nr:MAG: rhamnulokinase [Draconibacterium sp.]